VLTFSDDVLKAIARAIEKQSDSLFKDIIEQYKCASLSSMLDNSVASVCSIMSLNNESDCFSIARAINNTYVLTFSDDVLKAIARAIEKQSDSLFKDIISLSSMLDNSVASVCSIMSLNNESDCFSIARAIALL
jgi:3-methyladenine DNA glycosylase AlkD